MARSLDATVRYRVTPRGTVQVYMIEPHTDMDEHGAAALAAEAEECLSRASVAQDADTSTEA